MAGHLLIPPAQADVAEDASLSEGRVERLPRERRARAVEETRLDLENKMMYQHTMIYVSRMKRTSMVTYALQLHTLTQLPCARTLAEPLWRTN